MFPSRRDVCVASDLLVTAHWVVNMQNRVVVIGNITLDTLLRTDALPDLDGVAYVRDSTTSIGGRGAIVALSLAALGGRAPDLVATIGPTLAPSVMELMRLAGVRTECINIDSARKRDATVLVAIGERERNCVSFYVPPDTDATLDARQLSALDNAGLCYLGTTSRGVGRAAVARIPPSTMLVANVNKHLLHDSLYVRSIVDRANCLIGNADEIDALAVTLNLQSWRALADGTRDWVCRTDGERGADIVSRDGATIHQSCVPAQVVTPVGAGDAFAAGMLYGVLSRRSLERSLALAAWLAARSVSSTTSYPELRQLRSECEAIFGGSDTEGAP